MKLTIAAVGKLKEKHWALAAEEYIKRLNAYAKISIVEISEEKAPAKLNPPLERIVMQKEGARLLESVGGRSFLAALCIDGKKLSSDGLSAFLEDHMLQRTPEIVFAIGGSFGLCQKVVSRADIRLSFSDMTFPHQLMRVILLEQLYRSFKIMRAEPYHK